MELLARDYQAFADKARYLAGHAERVLGRLGQADRVDRLREIADEADGWAKDAWTAAVEARDGK
jgi:hypothetical protein